MACVCAREREHKRGRAPVRVPVRVRVCPIPLQPKSASSLDLFSALCWCDDAPVLAGQDEVREALFVEGGDAVDTFVLRLKLEEGAVLVQPTRDYGVRAGLAPAAWVPCAQLCEPTDEEYFA